MNIEDAQANMRHSYFGGAAGLASSAVIWLLAGSAAAVRDPNTGVMVLILGGMLIHPLAVLGSKILGRPGAHDRTNPLAPLALEGTVSADRCASGVRVVPLPSGAVLPIDAAGNRWPIPDFSDTLRSACLLALRRHFNLSRPACGHPHVACRGLRFRRRFDQGCVCPARVCSDPTRCKNRLTRRSS